MIGFDASSVVQGYDVVLVRENGSMSHYVRVFPVDHAIILPCLNVRWLVFPVAREPEPTPYPLPSVARV